MIRKTTCSETPVCVLKNSGTYFLHHAIIIKQEDGFRLIVVKNEKRLLDKTYSTLRGTRIAFSRSFKKNTTGLSIKVKAEWTGFYKPEKVFLDRITRYPLIKKVL